MRVSVDKRDRGFKYNPGAYRIKLNGEFVADCVTADEELGMLTRYKRDADGKPVVAPDGQHWELETVTGQVEIVVADQLGRNLRLPKVKVERNGLGVVEVLVYSQVKSGSIRRVQLDAKTYAFTGRDQEMVGAVRSVVSVSAGAAAEDLCKRNGDVFDPSDCAKLAVEEFDKLLALESTRH